MPATSRAPSRPPPGIPLFYGPAHASARFFAASARLNPNLTRQQPFPHALQTRDREEDELRGCPRPNVVLVSFHVGPLAVAAATAEKS